MRAAQTDVLEYADPRPLAHVMLIHNHQSVEPYVRCLDKAGFRVKTTRVDGARIDMHFLPSVLAFKPDIVVLDFDGSGDTQIIDVLKDEPRTRNIPIIGLAALGDVQALSIRRVRLEADPQVQR